MLGQLKKIAAQSEQTTKVLDAAIDHIEQLNSRIAMLEQKLALYEETCGTYEDVQAMAKAPIEELTESYEDMQEYAQHLQDEELTDDQKQYYYHQQN